MLSGLVVVRHRFATRWIASVAKVLVDDQRWADPSLPAPLHAPLWRATRWHNALAKALLDDQSPSTDPVECAISVQVWVL